MKQLKPLIVLFALCATSVFLHAADTATELKDVSINGGLQDGKARLVIEANLHGFPGDKAKPIFATTLQQTIKMTRDKLAHRLLVTMDILQGDPVELPLTIHGEGEIKKVTGDALQDWSVRQETNGTRTLVLRPRKGDKPITQLVVTIDAERDTKSWSVPTKTLTLAPPQPALFNGYVKVEAAPEWDVQADSPPGLVPIDPKFLPDGMRGESAPDEAPPLAFRFHGSAYTLPLKLTLADPEGHRVVLRDCRLSGRLDSQTAVFTLTATARVKNPKGGTLSLLSGGAALTALEAHPGWRVKFENGQFVLVFDQAGEFPIQIKFNAAVRQSDGWSGIDFRIAPSALQSVTLQGLAADTQFQFANAARPERVGNDFVSYLPADGSVKLSWKQERPEAEGKLFYAAEMLAQISVSPGLMRQVALLDGKVMQGELTRLTLLVRGAGEVTRVQGDQVLAWNVAPVPNSTNRLLTVQFNQPQKDQFALQVQMQTSLGAFPQSVEAMQLRPEGATRFAGYFRIVNEGAVRLEVAQATGLSQISPEQFPESDLTKAVLRAAGSQRFAYRFSGADFNLRIQADQILPELTVSEVLNYHLAENELAIDAEIELDIREAPLRELVLRVPKNYAIARLNAAGLSDYFLRDPADPTDAELRLVFGQPVSGRQVIQLRLERNQALGAASWALPRIEVTKAKSVRGNIGVSAEAGFRLTSERTLGLTEIATAFFPRKVAGIQAAFRLSDASWQATLRVERLPQTVLADCFHLFSIGEGIAYGSSVMNYLISGAPVAAFRIELSDEYFNVEFTGKDIRNWQKTTNGYLVQLHTPVSGTYTLLATYERPFKAQGETLAFTGARPLDAQSEQGHTLVISAYQFQVKPAVVESGLLELETAEVPAEYRLFFDAPILKAYRYTSRPFNLQLALSPLTQGDTLSQVVDRASFTTRISKEGQVLTDARYFVKSRGNPNFRLTLPAGMEMWSATVNGTAVVPVKDAQANLIPLPQRADPNAVLILDLKLASRSKEAGRVTVAAPIVSVPVMLAEWKLEPDTAQRLIYRAGSLTPVGGRTDVSGFAQLARVFRGSNAERASVSLIAAVVLIVLALIVWRWTLQPGVYRFSIRHLSGVVLGLLAFALAAAALLALGEAARQQNGYLPRTITFLAPVQQPNSALVAEVANVSDEPSLVRFLGSAWPAVFALLVWVYGAVTSRAWFNAIGWILGWTLVAWAALRSPNGAPFFLGVIAAFLLIHVIIPALRRLWQMPQRPRSTPPPPASENGAAAAVATVLLIATCLSLGSAVQGRESSAITPLTPALSPLRGEGVAAAAIDKQQFPAASVAGAMSSHLPLNAAATVAKTSDSSRAPSPLNGERAGVRGVSQPRGVQSSPILLLAQATAESPAVQQPGEMTKPVSLAIPKEPALAESVSQEIRVEEKFAMTSATIRWQATKGQLLPLLFEPAVLTRVAFPTNALKLVQSSVGGKRAQQLLALESGAFDVELHYQIQVTKRDAESGFALPTQFGLVNQLRLTLLNLDVDVLAPQAVSIQREAVGSNTVATLVISPVNDAWIGWKPRSRDVKREKPVFFAEIFQLYAPSAGVIEGAHYAAIRPAQGELSELVFDVPGGATITDVIDPAKSAAPVDAKNSKAPGTSASIVSLWRFDPDSRKLRVSLNPPQSRPFALLIRSQIATGPLPFEQSVGLLSVENAAGEIGLLGIATGNEVQLDAVTADALSPINLEDFPGAVAQSLQAQIPGLTVRRAFRYADAKAKASIKAAPVEPDVRVETQDTLSLGEDRIVLAANATVDITRAGIFRLSFLLPTNLDVEAISGPALSHWTEAKSDAGRVITLHLKGKTEGQQQFAISLAGPGVKTSTNWIVPQLILREASKQRGTLVLVPEQGMRLQAGTRTGVTQLDPQKSGIRQKGVLAFRILQIPWNLTLDIEQVDPWIQVTSLQHATLSEAQVKIAANLQYQIENTGLKAFRVFLPTNAESVRFKGEQVADFLPTAGAITNGMQEWEVKLHRRVIGRYLLQVNYQTLLPAQASEAIVRGVQAAEVNLQRGFVTVQSGGRLQLRVEALPGALQPTEWQSIPRALQQDMQATSANFAYRLVEPSFQLALKLDRHEAAKLLPARVNSITLTSVISDDGVMLTQARLEMVPGDKRLLHLTLPKEAEFWFAFVNQNGVWPWRETNQILIPLEQQSRGGKAIPVELFYSSRVGTPRSSALDLALLAPKFDLPLENITWRVYLSEKWQLADWSGSLQLQKDQIVARPAAIDVQTYLQNESSVRREKTKEAEQMLALGNTALEQGDPQQARRAFQSAYGLSQGDDAFNEDARVQLNNLKLQQALVGLNFRQSAVAGDSAGVAGKLRDLRGRKEVNYTQQDAKEIIDRSSAEENAAFMRLAERLIQQQDSAVSSPGAIRASVPEQGRLLTFSRSVAVDPWADLTIGIEAKAVRAASWSVRLVILGGTFLLLAGLALAARSFRRPVEG